jgi:hypothetical protein
MSEPGTIAFTRTADGTLVVRLSGQWQLSGHLPTTAAVEERLAAHPDRVSFHTAELGAWDTSILTFLGKVFALCTSQERT